MGQRTRHHENDVFRILFVWLICFSVFPHSGLKQMTNRQRAKSVGLPATSLAGFLPGVQLTITNQATGQERQVITDSGADYVVPALTSRRVRCQG